MFIDFDLQGKGPYQIRLLRENGNPICSVSNPEILYEAIKLHTLRKYGVSLENMKKEDWIP